MNSVLKSVGVGMFLAFCAQANLVTPWNETFATDPQTNAEYVMTIGSGISVVHDADNGLFTGTSTVSGAMNLYATMDDLGGGANQGFVLTVTVDSDYWQNQINAMAFSTDGTVNTGYAAYFRGQDEVAIRRAGVTVATIAKEVRADGVFDLVFEGTYNEQNELELTFTVTDQNDKSQTISYTDTTPLDGRKFGMTSRVIGGHSLSLDALSLNAVPEPATLGLFALSGSCMLVLRRLCRS